MGEDSVEFVRNGQSAIDTSLDYMPRSFDAETFKHSFTLASQMTPIALRLEGLARGADDGDFLFGSVAYSDALAIYAALGKASEADSRLLPFYQAMQTRFDKLRGKRTKPTE